ncbi:hypothetical protein CB0940_05138 [Cercospora beticola]|uniref:Uncharacterized protein n=1 Tax=Cercospora beticola TaxID=122368 RepID=A0A2G5HMN2_CERBT|nr:hypothetical protein CB0940_05138 [Cercospora beticola]PIA93472.1 hypothetical protein CB0940_05138 [Cercospora beticola]CAK1362664.1 unnamed protein product [Cercospora beticola]
MVARGRQICQFGSTLLQDINTDWEKGPSVFPIVFAAIIGQLMTALASWRLEKDIAIGALEYLLASRSLASALLALPRLQIICIWTPAILLTWCLSPLGGQATLRAVSPSVSHTLDSAWLVHLDFNGSQPISTYANDASSFGGVIRSAYVAALAGPNSTKQGSQDAFDNLHIPMLEAQSGQADENGWYNTTAAESAVNVALIGIPFSGAEQHGNSGFIMQTSYFYLDCATAMSAWKRRNETTAYPALPLANSALRPGLKLYNNTGFIPGTSSPGPENNPLLRDITANHTWNDTSPRVIGFQTGTFGNPNGGDPSILTEAWCNMTTTFVDVRFTCYDGPRNCTVGSIRRSLQQPFPSTATYLDGENPYVAESFFRQFMDAVPPNRNRYYTPLEQYFLAPATPFHIEENSDPIGNIGPELFSQRFTQLLNTFWLVSIAPDAVTGNFSAPLVTDLVDQASFQSEWGSYGYGIRLRKGQNEISFAVLRYSTFWLSTLVIISSLLVFAGLLTAVFDICRKGPTVLDEFVNYLRHNPVAMLDVRSSTEDGVDIARRHKNVKVRLGDVRPEEDVGFLAVGTLGTGLALDKIKEKRLYS